MKITSQVELTGIEAGVFARVFLSASVYTHLHTRAVQHKACSIFCQVSPVIGEHLCIVSLAIILGASFSLYFSRASVWVFPIAAGKLLFPMKRSSFIVEVKFISVIGDKTIPQTSYKK